MIGACALLAVTSLLAKLLGVSEHAGGLHPLQISAGRFFFALMGLGVVVAVMRPNLRGGKLGWHAGRATCGWLGATLTFAAVAHMPLADATALTFMSPVFTMLFAIPFLGDRIGPRRWTAVGVSLLGAALLTGIGGGAVQPAALLALAAAVVIGMESIFIKRLTDAEPRFRILVVNNAIGSAVACTAALFVWQWPTAEGWALLVLLGLTMVSAQVLYLVALTGRRASQVVPLFYTILVFAAIYDFALFGVVPEAVAWLGAGLIVAGSMAATLLGEARRKG